MIPLYEISEDAVIRLAGVIYRVERVGTRYALLSKSVKTEPPDSNGLRRVEIYEIDNMTKVEIVHSD